MAYRVPPEKKAKAVRLFMRGASLNHIALCLRLAKSTVRSLVANDPQCAAACNRTAGCQEQGLSLAEIYARRDAIRNAWSDEERERRAVGAYRQLPAVLECGFGCKHWNGEVMA